VGSSVEQTVDRFGTEWTGDRYFSGGDQNLVRFGSQERPVRHPFILGAPDQTLLRNFRTGDFAYKIPLAAGKYELRLYFSEVVLTKGDHGKVPRINASSTLRSMSGRYSPSSIFIRRRAARIGRTFASSRMFPRSPTAFCAWHSGRSGSPHG
jgi:hypothetical protein